ncbi:MAG: polysaccharide biosynthesis protein [Armatimonadetes bacterium]|nr:polysaccharide biosynthesis protein [Armatimonadota bacterium]
MTEICPRERESITPPTSGPFVRPVSWQAAVLVVTDVVSLLSAVALAFSLRFDGTSELLREVTARPISTALSVATCIVLFSSLGLYTCAWRFASLDILFAVVKGTLLGAGALLIYQYMIDRSTFPRPVLILVWLLSMILVGAARVCLRLVNTQVLLSHHRRRAGGVPRKRTRLLVVGAGELGAELVKRLLQHPEFGYEICGFVDDDLATHGTHVYGLRVLGSTLQLRFWLDELDIDEVIIAVPEWARETIRCILDECARTGVTAKTVPSTRQLLNGSWDLHDIRKVDVEDLLRREPVRVDCSEIETYLGGQTVLVTGAGGSIGSELCRQVLQFGPKQLIALDHEETSIFDLGQELGANETDTAVTCVVADVRDLDRLEGVFSRFAPGIVFHAAAYKHVPVMEANPAESIRNNIHGTRVVAEAADRHGTARFILVSTDKAVNPTSVMGATKRAAELLIQLLNSTSSTKFMSVRFGNVLDSRGSVVPIFRRQIEHGGPVTVTDPDMERYFMTIPEAVQLVLQAGALGEGGEIFVLDMGERVKIVDLARDLIRLCGYEPDRDIRIEFVGTRPGEKLREELQTEGEDYAHTRHSKIFVAKPENGIEAEAFRRALDELCELAVNGVVREQLAGGLRQIVPNYQPDAALLSAVR